MMKKIVNLLLLWFLLILTGCSTSYKAQNNEPVQTNIPTKTETFVFPEITSTEEEEMGSDVFFQYVCGETYDFSELIDDKFQGKIVLAKTKSDSELVTEIDFLNIQKGKESLWNDSDGNHRLGLISISPSGKYIVYVINDLNGNIENIYITDKDRNSSDHFPKNLIDTGIFWINDENILTVLSGNNPLLRIISTIDYEIESEIPGYYGEKIDGDSLDLISTWGFYNNFKNIYSADLSRFIYPSISAEPVIILRDVDQGKDLLTYPTYNGWGYSPTWSNNDQNFAISITSPSDQSKYGIDNVVVINRNGEIIYISDFLSKFPIMKISNLSWSNNGQYLAFTYSTTDEFYYFSEMQMGVIDIYSGSISLYCTGNLNNSSPIWSPDGKYILLNIIGLEENEENLYIIDLNSGSLYFIENGYKPIGWMQ